MKKEINPKIEIAMAEACLTQKDVAKKLGVKQALISKWVTRKLNPKLSTLEKIANATDKSLNFF